MADNDAVPRTGRKRLLVVDDEPGIRDTISALLREWCDVATADGGPAALESIRKDPPDVMLLDVSMPGMSGIEVLQALRRKPPATTIVMLTSRMEMEVVQQALELGAKEYITKPFEAADLRASVRRLLESPPAGGGHGGAPWRVAT